MPTPGACRHTPLDEVRRLVDPGLPVDRHGAIGQPTAVVHAADLTVPAILDGVRRGRVFVDVEGTRDRLLKLTPSLGGHLVVMSGKPFHRILDEKGAHQLGEEAIAVGPSQPIIEVVVVGFIGAARG